MMHRFLAWVLGSQGLVVRLSFRHAEFDVLWLEGEIPRIKYILSLRKRSGLEKTDWRSGWAGGLPYETALWTHIQRQRTISFLVRPGWWVYQWPHTYWDFPGGASGKEPAYQCSRCKRRRFDPWVGKIPWRRKGTPLQYCGLEKSIGLQGGGHDRSDLAGMHMFIEHLPHARPCSKHFTLAHGILIQFYSTDRKTMTQDCLRFSSGTQLGQASESPVEL